jgi:NAD(P)-dependent dehydrogenase (short-subunit alcohol dehydrogenase family)
MIRIDFVGKMVVVTGSSSGIGSAIAMRARIDGATVCI